MSPLRLNGSTSGYSQLDAPAIAGDQTFTLPGTGGTIDRLNRAGNILQVVEAASTTTLVTTSTSYVDTGLSASITPSSAANKVLILISHGASGADAATNSGIGWNLLRNATSIFTDAAHFAHPATFTFIYGQGWTTYYLDSPATTSSTTYKTQARTVAGTQITVDDSITKGKIILMEVAA